MNVLVDLRMIQTGFSKEVQEWKNTLLRGHETKDYQKYSKEFDAAVKETLLSAEKLKTKLNSADDRKYVDHFISEQKTLKDLYIQSRDTYLAPGNFDYKAADKQVRGKDRAVTEALVKLGENIVNQAIEGQLVARSTLDKNFLLALGLALGGLLIGGASGFIFAYRTARKITLLSQDLLSGAYSITEAAGNVSHSSHVVSQTSVDQASSLEQTAATIEEITSMVKLNTDNSKVVAKLAVSTRDAAVKGQDEIRKLITSIKGISSDSKKIAEITQVIDEIAFQTNLLALNASVEAARAGEHGRGFAIVADAVRSLAQRSATSAKDISTLISGSVSRIEASGAQANISDQVLGDIVESIKKVADLNNEIATAGEEQTSGILQIGKAMNQIDQVTQKNAAASEEAAVAAEELASQSKMMQEQVRSLNVVINGKTLQTNS
jgi:methyl-accepting chemotaxis protein